MGDIIADSLTEVEASRSAHTYVHMPQLSVEIFAGYDKPYKCNSIPTGHGQAPYLFFNNLVYLNPGFGGVGHSGTVLDVYFVFRW